MTLPTIIFGIIALILVIVSIASSRNIQLLNAQKRALECTLADLNQKIEDEKSSLTNIKSLVDQYEHSVNDLQAQKQSLNADINASAENIEKLKSSYEFTNQEFQQHYMDLRKSWIEAR